MKEIDLEPKKLSLLRLLGRVQVATYVTALGAWAGLVIGVARYMVEGEPLWAVLLIAFGPLAPILTILMVLDWRGRL